MIRGVPLYLFQSPELPTAHNSLLVDLGTPGTDEIAARVLSCCLPLIGLFRSLTGITAHCTPSQCSISAGLVLPTAPNAGMKYLDPTAQVSLAADTATPLSVSIVMLPPGASPH